MNLTTQKAIPKRSFNESFTEFVRLAKRDKYLLMLVLPGAIFLFVFCYIPMYGVIFAFQDYAPGRNMFFGAEWVGLKWFQQFFSSMFFGRILTNTILISLFTLIFSFPAPIIFALMLNEVKEGAFRKTVQSISYLPHFISTVIIVGLIVNLFSLDGILTELVNKITGHRRGIQEQSFSFGTAVGLFNSVVNFGFVYGTNAICRKVNDVSLW